MYDTEKCVELVKLRAREMRRKQEKKAICGLSTLCMVLFASCVGMIGAMTEQVGQLRMREMYGTMLLHEDAGGYVLVGVIAFVAAVVITLSCIRCSEKLKKNRCQDMEKKDSGKD